MIKTIALIIALIVLGVVSTLIVMVVASAIMCLLEYLGTKLKRRIRKYYRPKKTQFINPERLRRIGRMFEDTISILFLLLVFLFIGVVVASTVLSPLF